MKKLIIIGSLVVAGCATSTRVNELEQRLAKVEQRFCRMSPKVAKSDNVDVKIKAFIKEYAGVEFGDSRSLYVTNKSSSISRKMLKHFQYFEDVQLSFLCDQLTGVEFYCNISTNYSFSSSKARIDQMVSDMLVAWGLAGDYLDAYYVRVGRGESDDEKSAIARRIQNEATPGLAITRNPRNRLLDKVNRNKSGVNYFCIRVNDSKLERTLIREDEDKRNSVGEDLPDADEAGLKAMHEALEYCKVAEEKKVKTQTRSPAGRTLDSSREWRVLREQRQQDAEFETVMANGDADQELKRLEEATLKSRAKYENMLALDEKSKTLSADALAIYRKRLDRMERKYETCSNRLARARAMCTPEKIAEIERKKKVEEEEQVRKQKAEEEYKVFAADADEEFMKKKRREAGRAAEKAERDKERAEMQKKLAEMAEELKRAREEAEKNQ